LSPCLLPLSPTHAHKLKAVFSARLERQATHNRTVVQDAMPSCYASPLFRPVLRWLPLQIHSHMRMIMLMNRDHIMNMDIDDCLSEREA
jgi:hypothetical protein